MQVSTRRFLTPLFNPHFMSEYAVPNQLAEGGVCGSICFESPLFLTVSTLAQGDESAPIQNLGAASLPNLNRMRHQGFHKSISSLPFITENRQFHQFIIITMILTAPHDSAIRW